ncbi:MAG: tetratricopeptide repeat protein [Verrucomicrobia bacterium]|nr:tetratricopeptide repeat protein [Verrucomicrobiota bacterium]MBU1735472.1 tetratricopeptide repeat protein [Verrucomicrobiota bacterium]MBU1856867.1 tetratricopeptide repeat protein [Verrucomicrobiota bacterium]
MAEALAQFSMGILREGLADGSALASYRRALEEKPDYDALYVRAAVLYIKQGQNDKAIALMEDACRHNPRSVEACLYLAQVYQALNQSAKAIKTAQRAIRIEPANAKGYIQLAYLYLAARDEVRALATLEKARNKVTDKLPVLRLMGDLSAQKIVDTLVIPSLDAAKAIAYYEEAATLPPDDASLQYQERLGDLYLINRQMDKALASFQNLTTRLPDTIQLQKKLAMCYMALGQKEKAVKALKVVIGREPDNYQVQFYLGELYETLGNTNAAVASFRSAVDTNPSTATPYQKLAFYYMKTEPEKAGQTLQNGLKRFPEDKKLLEMVIQYYLRNQQPLEALESFVHLQNLLLRDNEHFLDSRYFLNFGDIAQQNQMYDTAIALYEMGLEQDPDLLEAYIRLACLHLSTQATDEALNVMDEAVLSHPEDPVAWYYFGLLNNQAQVYPTAISAFERVETLAAKFPKASLLLDSMFYFNYGTACERSGQFECAVALLQRAIQLDTENTEAFNYLAYMWAEKGIHLDQALEYSRHSLDCDPDNGAFLDTLGWILYKQKLVAEALICLQSACYFMPDDPTILEHLGDAWQALHNESQSLAWWERSYRINANNKKLEEKLRKHGVDINALRQNASAP